MPSAWIDQCPIRQCSRFDGTNVLVLLAVGLTKQFALSFGLKGAFRFLENLILGFFLSL